MLTLDKALKRLIHETEYWVKNVDPNAEPSISEKLQDQGFLLQPQIAFTENLRIGLFRLDHKDRIMNIYVVVTNHTHQKGVIVELLARPIILESYIRKPFFQYLSKGQKYYEVKVNLKKNNFEISPASFMENTKSLFEAMKDASPTFRLDLSLGGILNLKLPNNKKKRQPQMPYWQIFIDSRKIRRIHFNSPFKSRNFRNLFQASSFYFTMTDDEINKIELKIYNPLGNSKVVEIDELLSKEQSYI